MKICNIKINMLVCILLCVCLLASCTDSLGENSSIQSSQSSKANSQVKKDPLEAGKGDDTPRGPAPEPKITDDKIRSVGQDIVYEFPNGEKIEYNVKNVSVFNNLKDSGAKLETLNDPSAFDANGSLKDGFIFVVITVQTKNISISDDDQNISNIGLRYSPAQDQDSTLVSEFICFLNSEKDHTDREYYHFQLPKGQSKEIKVGWIVDTNSYEKSKLYLSVGEMEGFSTMNQSNNRQFIKLGL